jgi:TPR repeat protein
MKSTKSAIAAGLTFLIIGAGVVHAAKDNTKAREQALKACEAKEMKACFEAAKLHWGEDGAWIVWKTAWGSFEKGVNLDKAKALAFHQKGCDSKSAPACYGLGVMHYNGWGVPKDETKALLAYQRSCDGGDAAGCYGYGQSLRQAKGGPKDEAKALVVYKKSCDACGKIGTMYEGGLGVAKSEAKAAQWYQTACDGRNLRGCNALAGLYQKGAGVPKDEPKAIALYKQACDAGFKDACPKVPGGATAAK